MVLLIIILILAYRLFKMFVDLLKAQAEVQEALMVLVREAMHQEMLSSVSTIVEAIEAHRKENASD
jgi:hypothetical protein